VGIGPGSGPAGRTAGPSNTQDNKQVDPPAPPIDNKNAKNVTPYQNLIYAGMGALLVGALLLMVAAQLIKSANFAGAKMAAMGAAACGGVAMGIGGLLAGKWGQMMQGIPFLAGGGILAAAAVKVMMEADKASQDAKDKTDKTAKDNAQAINEKNESKVGTDSSGDCKTCDPNSQASAESPGASAESTANMGAQAAGAAAGAEGQSTPEDQDSDGITYKKKSWY